MYNTGELYYYIYTRSNSFGHIVVFKTVLKRHVLNIIFERSLSCSEPQTLLTVCLLKPTVWNQSVAQTVHTLQLRGLSLVGLRVLTLDKHTASSLLPAEDVTKKYYLPDKYTVLLSTFRSLDICVNCFVQDPDVEYLCSGPSLALCLQGEGAVTKLLDVAHSNTGIYGTSLFCILLYFYIRALLLCSTQIRVHKIQYIWTDTL